MNYYRVLSYEYLSDGIWGYFVAGYVAGDEEDAAEMADEYLDGYVSVGTRWEKIDDLEMFMFLREDEPIGSIAGSLTEAKLEMEQK